MSDLDKLEALARFRLEHGAWPTLFGPEPRHILDVVAELRARRAMCARARDLCTRDYDTASDLARDIADGLAEGADEEANA